MKICPRGYTLVDLVIVVAIAGVVLGAGVPGWQSFVRRNTMAATLNSFHRYLRLARDTAITEDQQAVICASADKKRCQRAATWGDGWIVFLDPNHDRSCNDADGDTHCDKDGGRIVAVHGRLDGGVRILGNHNVAWRVRYKASGMSPFANGTFILCDRNGRIGKHDLVLSNSGRARIGYPGPGTGCP